ncbi:ERF family protein [Sulfobacillus thermosulfidooxidans]|uniref:ERF family protein n=1 Tax=Sulfobacillus thermosulfidooxidans TaxID=28034 RepID=UPI0006B49858|nr:ERF family protein [Sulfobacillus thermosulfidooxidans]
MTPIADNHVIPLSKNPAPSLIAKLARVLGQIHRVPKRGKNTFHNYEYATESDILDAVRKYLAEENLFILSSIDQVQQTVLETSKTPQIKTTVTMTFTLLDGDSGESLISQFQGEGADATDKGLPKAITACVKYFLKTNFLIATGEDAEGDTLTDALAAGKMPPSAVKSSPKAPPAAPKATSPAASKAPAPQPENPKTPDTPSHTNSAPSSASDSASPTASSAPTNADLAQIAQKMKAKGIAVTQLLDLIRQHLHCTVKTPRDLTTEQIPLVLAVLEALPDSAAS